MGGVGVQNDESWRDNPLLEVPLLEVGLKVEIPINFT